MSSADEISKLHFENYEILARLAAATTGQVFKVKHRIMGRLAVIKVLSQEAAATPEVVERFYRKVRILAQLNHPNVVAAYESGMLKSTPYLVSEYVDGHDLRTLLKRFGPLPLAHAVDYVRQAARGLAYLHSHGVYHRNVKPSNVMVDKQGVVKLIGLGIARVAADSALETEPMKDLTRAGSALGSYDFMAPEQAVDAHAADHRADIYSLGCTLHALLTGAPPYQAKSAVQLVVAHQSRPIPSLTAARPEMPKALDALFQRMLAKRLEDRPASMDEVLAEMDKCLEEEASPAATEESGAGETSSEQTFNSLLASLGQEVTRPRQALQKASRSPAPTTAAAVGTTKPRQGAARPAGRQRQIVVLTIVNSVFAVGLLALLLVLRPWERSNRDPAPGKNPEMVAGAGSGALAIKTRPIASDATALTAKNEAPAPPPNSKADAALQPKTIVNPGGPPSKPPVPQEKPATQPEPSNPVANPARPPKLAQPPQPFVRPTSDPPDRNTEMAKEQLVRQTFARELRDATTPAGKADLARKLLESGLAMHDDAAGRYVLLRMAGELAADGDDEPAAELAIDALRKFYSIDVLQRKVDAVQRLAHAAHTNDEHWHLAERAADLSSQALERDRYALAGTLASLAQGEAAKTREKESIATTRAATAAVTDAQRIFALAQAATKKLQQDPENARAKFALGWCECVVKRHWDEGLPLLAAGSDDAMCAVASADLARPVDPQHQIALADAWWNVAEAKSGLARRRLQQRAAFWYAKALPAATGLEKTKIEKRLQEAGNP